MKIRWTQSAIDDLNHAYEYIAINNPEAAASVIEKIEKSLQIVRSYPDIGRTGRVTRTRDLIIVGTPFIVPYRVRNQQIEILGIIHSSRQWPKIF